MERFRSFLAPLFLILITTSGFSICVSIYVLAFVSYAKQLTTSYLLKNDFDSFQSSHENLMQSITYILSMMYAVFDIFVIMYLANELKVASDQLPYCLFESNWIEQSESCKKCVVIMGEALKQPHELIILIYPMNLNTFLSVSDFLFSLVHSSATF